MDFITDVVEDRGWRVIHCWFKLQPANGIMPAHQDSASRKYTVSLIVRVTIYGDGGFIDMISDSNPLKVYRVHLPQPTIMGISRIGGGMVSSYSP